MLSPAFPPCFPDAASYELWAQDARRVRNESAVPCDDCTHAYREAMQRDGRCDPRATRERFRVDR